MRLRPPRLASPGRPRLSAGIAAVLLGVLASGFAGVAGGAAATTPKPVIVAFTALPTHVSSDGGAVKLSVRVANATTCTFRGQSTAFSSYNRTKTVRCTSGRATATLTVAPNIRAVPVTIHYLVRATAGSRSVQKALAVVEAAAPNAGVVTPPPVPPAIATTSLPGATVGTAYATTLTAAGGTEPYTWTVTQGTLPSGLTLAASGEITGTPTMSGTAAFTVQVVDAAQQSATASLSIAVLQPVLPVSTMAGSSNWSGYSLESGPFTSVTGTFTVPQLSNTGGGSVHTSEWIGIDGDLNSSLIQAGVAESYSQFSGSTSTYAWWEILPAPSTPIDTMTVQPGDSVTVTIQQVSAGQWSILVLDNTNGQSFTTTQAYDGEGSSAEWIVEAPTVNSRQSTLGAYTPNVTFTGMGWSGTATQFVPIQMVQSRGGGVVSIPSDLSGDQTSFVVAYGSTQPPAPS